MNAQLQKLKKLWTTLSAHLQIGHVSYERTGISPKHDWLIMLLLTALISGIFAIGALYLYIQVDAGTLFPVPTDSNVPQKSIDAELLKKTIHTFDQKEANISTTSTTTEAQSIPRDPSL